MTGARKTEAASRERETERTEMQADVEDRRRRRETSAQLKESQGEQEGRIYSLTGSTRFFDNFPSTTNLFDTY